jgi:hypothetical protein
LLASAGAKWKFEHSESDLEAEVKDLVPATACTTKTRSGTNLQQMIRKIFENTSLGEHLYACVQRHSACIHDKIIHIPRRPSNVLTPSTISTLKNKQPIHLPTMTSAVPNLNAFHTTIATTTAQALANQSLHLTFQVPPVTCKDISHWAAVANKAKDLCRPITELLGRQSLASRTAGPAAQNYCALMGEGGIDIPWEGVGEDYGEIGC